MKKRHERSRYGPNADSSDDDYYRERPRSPRRAYKVLCVSSLPSKASDEAVKDSLYRDFKRFGDFSIRVTRESDERVAYVCFRSAHDAREARRARPRVLVHDKPALVEPVLDAAQTPPTYTAPEYNYYPHSPELRTHYDAYTATYPSYPTEYRRERDVYEYAATAHARAYPLDYYGYYPQQPRRAHAERHEHKRDKFPNYLQHVLPEDDPLATRTLFAGNLEINIMEEELKLIFGRYGALEDVDIKRPSPGTGNAFAFVKYRTLDMAYRAKVALSGQYIGKFQCKIGYGKATPTAKIWVGGLGPWCFTGQLEREFDRFGAIKTVEYKRGDVQAFVTFQTVDAAQAAVKEMRGFPLGGADKRLRTDFADLAPSRARSREREKEAEPDFDRFNRTAAYSDSNSDSGSNSNNTNITSSKPGKAISFTYCKTLPEIARKSATAWQGGLILKNSLFPTKIHLIDGDCDIVDTLMREDDGQNQLRITQRLRLDQPKLDDVERRLSSANSHAVFLGMTTTTSSVVSNDSSVQVRPLRNLVSYLKQKEAAGVISLLNKETEVTGLLYTFPPCLFSANLLKRACPNLSEEALKEDHLVVVVVRGASC